MWIVKESSPTQQPSCPWVNLTLLPGSTLASTQFRATLLLENPLGKNKLTYSQLQPEVRTVRV